MRDVQELKGSGTLYRARACPGQGASGALQRSRLSRCLTRCLSRRPRQRSCAEICRQQCTLSISLAIYPSSSSSIIEVLPV